MKPAYWIVVAVLFWLALVIKDVPASWGSKMFNGAIDGLQLSGVTGNLWNGQAARALLEYQGDTFSLGEMRWQLHPWSLLTLSPCVDFQTELHRQRLEGEACVHLDGSWSLHNSEFNGPAALIELWMPVQVDGELSVRLDELRVDGDRIEKLQADSSWRNARFHNSQQWLSLGSFASHLEADSDGGIGGEIFDIDGHVSLKLVAEVPYRRPLSLQGSAQLRVGAPREIAQWLTIMGYREVNGSFDIVWVQN